MFWWTDRFRSVVIPCFDQVGTFPYYVMLVIQQLTAFSVPSFLFVSGFFVAYAARGERSTLTWKTVGTRIGNLLVPYLIWSTVILIADAFQGLTYTGSSIWKSWSLEGRHLHTFTYLFSVSYMFFLR